MDIIIDDRQPSYETKEGASAADAVREALQKYRETSDETPVKTKDKPKDIYSDFLENSDWGQRRRKKKKQPESAPVLNKSNKDLQKILAKSVITPDFEQLHSIPPYDVREKKLQEMRKKEREKTKGSKWFGMPATEVTEELEKDLKVLQMRSVLDPKHFYKKNDLKVLPKYFQIGKVMDSPLDYYNNRLTKKERKKTLVDELLADAQFSKYNKRKYQEIIEDKRKTHYKAYMQAKRLKKKHKK